MAPGEAQRVHAYPLARQCCRAALLALSLTRNGAAEAPPAFGLEYIVPARCPERGWFAEHVSAPPDAGAHSLQVQVKVEPSASGFQGQLAIYESREAAQAAAHPLRSRQLEGAGCSELLSALAFNLSLFLDELHAAANVSAQPDPAPSPAHLSTSVALPPRDGGPGGAPSAATRHWPAEVSGAVLLRSGLGPGLDLNARLAVAAGPPGAHVAGYELAFELGQGLATGHPESAGTNVDWEHRWWGARASAGPWSYVPLPWLALTPYLAGQLGRYQAWLAGRTPEGSWFAWFEPGLRVRAGSWLFARGELGAVLPIAPLRVDIDGAEAARQRFGVSVGLSLGILFSGR
jgi:hypothetical protein